MRSVFIGLAFLLAACDGRRDFLYADKEVAMVSLGSRGSSLKFSCAYEDIPSASKEADSLFRYARWLQKNNVLKPDLGVAAQIERIYRISSESGSFKANINLQNGGMRGYFDVSGREHLRFSEQLINAKVATGYYFVALFLKQGAAGLEKDEEMALRYYRKAADLGSAQAQAYLGNKLAPIAATSEVAQEMRRCAAEQGHSEAAVKFGIFLKSRKRYKEALDVFQVGAAAGGPESASRLAKAFRTPEIDNELHYLAQEKDLERAN